MLTPLFALRHETDLGVGDTEALRQFIDWSRALGFQMVQLLPINETGGDHSAYNAISSRAIDPTTLHLAAGSPIDLTAAAFTKVTRDVDLTALRRGPVQYETVKPLKKKLLESAYATFRERLPNEEFATFCATESAWLDDYARFRVLMEANDERETWDQWSAQSLGQRTSSAFVEREQFFRYVQWIAHEQWRAVKVFAEEKGVALMGDIPFGVSYYSADVFAHPELFRLDWSGGAPPEPYFKDDEFTQKWGQNWGIPLYDWTRMRTRHLDWWRQRVRGVKQIFHLFRIDHILGFYRIYAFPWRPDRNAEFLPLSWDEMRQRTDGREPHFAPRDDRTWENCEANRREGEEYLRVVLEESGATRVVGEDLGTVPDYVRPSLHSLGIAGFKIPQWETSHDHAHVIPGNTYERLSVATFATHDHKPLRALWDEALTEDTESARQSRDDLRKAAEFAGFSSPNEPIDYLRDFYPAAFAALFHCNAWIAIVMITDLLGRKDRFNVPGTAADFNWTRRLHTTVKKLGGGRGLKRQLELIHEMLQKSGRLSASLSTAKERE